MGLLDSSGSADGESVTCVACGADLPRSDAREYDKYGDRWDRDGKRFEYLCKPCYGDYAHLPRDGLEETLVRAGAGETDRRRFLAAYDRLVTRRSSTE